MREVWENLVNWTGWSQDYFLSVQVMPESYWLEANWAQNVQIINNYIEGPYGGILVGLIRLYEQGSGLFLNHRYAGKA